MPESGNMLTDIAHNTENELSDAIKNNHFSSVKAALKNDICAQHIQACLVQAAALGHNKIVEELLINQAPQSQLNLFIEEAIAEKDLKLFAKLCEMSANICDKINPEYQNQFKQFHANEKLLAAVKENNSFRIMLSVNFADQETKNAALMLAINQDSSRVVTKTLLTSADEGVIL
jgi:hypothetical protein